jgi:hypothetical protein
MCLTNGAMTNSSRPASGLLGPLEHVQRQSDESLHISMSACVSIVDTAFSREKDAHVLAGLGSGSMRPINHGLLL